MLAVVEGLNFVYSVKSRNKGQKQEEEGEGRTVKCMCVCVCVCPCGFPSPVFISPGWVVQPCIGHFDLSSRTDFAAAICNQWLWVVSASAATLSRFSYLHLLGVELWPTLDERSPPQASAPCPNRRHLVPVPIRGLTSQSPSPAPVLEYNRPMASTNPHLIRL